MFAEVRVRAWIVALAVLGLLAAGLVWQQTREEPDRATRTAAPACADVRLVLVPGNAQGSASDPGATLKRFVQRFAAVTAGRRTLDQVVVANPTRPVSVLGTRYPRRPANQVISQAQVRGWETGINVTATKVNETLAASAASCPNTALVVAGYSQGAGSVHRAMTHIAQSSGVGRRLIGVVLIGDPDRRKDTRARSIWRPGFSGIEYTKRIKIADVPSPSSAVATYSLCQYGDLVCSFGNQPIATGIVVHNRYATLADSVYDAPARPIVDVALRIPRIATGAIPFSGAVGDQFREQIPVKVLSSELGRVVFSAQTPMPPGLQLNPSGLISGLPTTAGTTTVRFRVQNTRSAAVGLPVVGYLTITIKPSQGLRISAGGESSCVVRLDHELNCWGANGYGQLGDGTKTDKRAPVRIGTGVWNEVATSGTHTCGIRTSQSLWCWGNNKYGQLGNGTTTESLRPTQIATFARWRAVSANNFNSCAITTGGGLWCWGNNLWGQVGNGTTATALRPRSLGTGWTSVSSGAWNTCATKLGGQLWCWGANDFGQVGDGTRTTRTVPTRVGPGFTWTGVSIGSMHACGLLASGGARCWGVNVTGQLGNGNTTNALRSVAVYGTDQWRGITAGDLFSCGIKLDDSVWCWGSGSVGQRGSGVRGNSATPVRVSGTLTGARITAGWSHTCAAESATEGALSCWGYNNRGQLGDSSTALRTAPKRVALP